MPSHSERACQSTAPLLIAAGWSVHDFSSASFHAARGLAMRSDQARSESTALLLLT